MDKDIQLNDYQKRQLAEKDQNKKKWINDIYMKRMHRVPLTKEDYSFLINMQLSGGNEEYANLIKADIEVIQSVIEERGDDMDVEKYIAALQNQVNLKNSIYRNVKQGQKDDAVTRKMDVDTLNRYARMAQEEGVDLTGEMAVKMREAVKKEHELRLKDSTK